MTGAAALALTLGVASSTPVTPAGPHFRVSVDPRVRRAPLTGRVFVFVTKAAGTEPRLQYNGLAQTVPFFGVDVDALAAGGAATIDATTLGYPLVSLRDLPPGDYFVQALANVYTHFARGDGNTIWVHRDRGEGQLFTRSPGNLVSRPVRVHLDGTRSTTVALRLDRAIPPIAPPVDTPYVKHVRIQSALLSHFWGAPIMLGATVLLPHDYAATTRRYPAVYVQDHFTTAAPFGFDPSAKPETAGERAERLARTNAESRYDFTRAWISGTAPPIVAITFIHPTPYYDDSYAVDSANNGPYGTALVTELIPYLERTFRLIPDGRARFLTGVSTGGWETLALQIFHPTTFNGAWAIAPDPVDFHRFQLGDMYGDVSAFSTQRTPWIASEIPAQRDPDGNVVQTMREESRLEAVLGSHGRSGEQFNAWDAAFGPVLQDGYPGEMWDKRTGTIDHNVIDNMVAHGFDLAAYLRAHWPEIGTDLAGKLHVDVGDDDDYFLNLACYRLDEQLRATHDPDPAAIFSYGRKLKPHGWQAQPNLVYLRQMVTRSETANLRRPANVISNNSAPHRGER